MVSFYPLNEFYFYAGIVWIVFILGVIIGLLVYPRQYGSPILAGIFSTFMIIGFLTSYGPNYAWKTLGIADDWVKIILIYILVILCPIYLFIGKYKISEPLLVQGFSYIPLIVVLILFLSSEEERIMIFIITGLIVFTILLISPPPFSFFGIALSIAYFVAMVTVGKVYPFSEFWYQIIFVTILLFCSTIRLLSILVRIRRLDSVVYIICYMLPMFMLIMWIWSIIIALFSVIVIGVCTILVLLAVKFNVIKYKFIFSKNDPNKGQITEFVKSSELEKTSYSSQVREKFLTLIHTFFTKTQENPKEEEQYGTCPTEPSKIPITLDNIRPNIRLGRLLYLITLAPAVGLFIILSDVGHIFPWYISFHEIYRAALYYPELLPQTIFLVAGIIFIFYFVFTAPIYIWRDKKRLKKEDFF